MADLDPVSPLTETATALAIATLKSIGEQPAMLANLAFANIVANTNLSQQNAVANQQAMNELGISIVGKTVNAVANLGPLEARSAVDVLSNNELAASIADLKASLDSFDKTRAAVAPAAPAGAPTAP